MSAMILGMGIFYGGIAQVIERIMEWKKNNTFAATAFTSYGMFWMVFVAIKTITVLGLADAPDGKALLAFLFMWG